jgi:2-octaprenyl-6-methoxyphenol hydroxylase
MHLARALVSDRFAVVGDAARVVHPIAGQGLNLGLRDVAALTEVIADAARLGLDTGSQLVLERYERWRRLDSALSAASYDALNRLFSNDWTLLRTARDFGLAVLDQFPALKQVLVAEAAGVTGEVPKLLRGERA